MLCGVTCGALCVCDVTCGLVSGIGIYRCTYIFKNMYIYNRLFQFAMVFRMNMDNSIYNDIHRYKNTKTYTCAVLKIFSN